MRTRASAPLAARRRAYERRARWRRRSGNAAYHAYAFAVGFALGLGAFVTIVGTVAILREVIGA